MPALLKSILLDGFLSFGQESELIELRPLNVIIGPNGCGKSNLVEALAVLRAAPGDLPVPIREGGGVRDWLWKGQSGDEVGSWTIEVVFNEGVIALKQEGHPSVRYRLTLGPTGSNLEVRDERIETETALPGVSKPYLYFGYERGKPMLNVNGKRRTLQRENIDPTQSILSQRRDAEAYPELTRIADQLADILIYRSWSFGPNAIVRRSCSIGARQDRLGEELDNLPVRLAAMKRTPNNKRRILSLLGEVSSGLTDIEIIPEGGRLQLYLTEGSRNIPAHRLSDGTLRFLCLAAILIDPVAPLIVIEEPELGLHPDLMPVLRDLLVEASAKTQLIITTHSTVLADAMTEYADSVLVCEKHESSTHLTRLSQEEIDRWKVEGGLGHLWMSGRLGGTRW